MRNGWIKLTRIMMIVSIVAVLIFCYGCSNSKEDKQTQIANPASVYCKEKGGSIQIVDEENGQRGLCTLKDGTICDEWEYFRGECGQNTHTCTTEEKNATICTMEYMPVCGDDNVTYGNKCSACASGKIDSWSLGECQMSKTCSDTCPMLSRPSPDFCKNGKIIPGDKDECGCATTPKCIKNDATASSGKKAPHYCGDETPRTNACTKEYRPVCGFFNQDIKCVKAPCAVDAGNPCMACNNPDVDYWVEGECNSP